MTPDAKLLKKMNRLLKVMGGVYELEDIIDNVKSGKMQGHTEGNSWAVTQVIDFPRARVLQVVAVVGDMDAVDVLDGKVQEYARLVGATRIRTFGRNGWKHKAAERGWKQTQAIFVKEI